MPRKRDTDQVRIRDVGMALAQPDMVLNTLDILITLETGK